MARLDLTIFNGNFTLIYRYSYLDAYQISEVAFQHLAFILENEIDWPQLSYLDLSNMRIMQGIII